MRKLLFLTLPLTPLVYGGLELPRYFEANMGQAPSHVRFLSRSADHTLFLADQEAIFSGSAGSVVLRFANFRADVKLNGIDSNGGKVNYLIGDHPESWLSNVPVFRGVKYSGVYRGIDVVFNGSEYDFLLAPGADPARIELEFRGARNITIDDSGDLIVRLTAGILRQPKPVAFQDGKIVPAAFVRRSATRFGFRLGRYDRARPLVIDPVLLYSTYLGGSGTETQITGLGSRSQLKTAGIAVDAAGNTYVTGFTESVDFRTVNGFEPIWTGSTDAFVAKINAAGNSLIYATYLGGPGGLDRGFDIAVDQQGNAYVAGRTQSPAFPVRNPFQARLRGTEDGFITKLDASGGSLIWSTYFGGSNNDDCHSIAVLNGSIYVTGETQSPDFPLEAFVNNAFLGNPTDVFVSRFSPDGSRLVFSTFLGGSGFDDVEDLAVDSDGNVYVAGYTEMASIPLVPFRPPGGPPDVLPRILQQNASGATDGYLVRYSPSGQMQFATYIGGSGPDAAFGVAVRSSRDVYLVGTTASRDFPIVSPAFQPLLAGGADAWLARINTESPQLMASTLLGGPGEEIATAVAVDQAGRAWIAGLATAGLPLRDPIQSLFGGDDSDAFLARLDTSGLELQFSTFLGGSGADAAFGLALDSSGNAYLTGFTESENFPIAAFAMQPRFGGGRADAFVVKVGDVTGPVVLSGATFTARPLAPESYATLFAPGLAGATAVIVIDRTGAERPGLISAVTAGQLNFVLPAGLVQGPATVRVLRNAVELARAPIEIAPISPGLFTANANGLGVPAALVVHTDPAGAQSVVPVFECGLAPGSCVPVPVDISGPGVYDLLLFGTGIRGRSSLAGVFARIGPGRLFAAQYAGPQNQYPGLDQVNVRLPRVLIGSGEVDLDLAFDGQLSNRTRISFR